MFANLVQLITGRPPASAMGRSAFIEELRVADEPVRSVRMVRLLAVGWALIAVKHVAIIWAVSHYHIPFHQLWINFPTWMLGLLATVVYYSRTRRA